MRSRKWAVMCCKSSQEKESSLSHMVYSRNWPIRGKWVLPVILGGAFFNAVILKQFRQLKKPESLGLFFILILLPIWCCNINFMRHFFPICGNPAKLRSRINPGYKYEINTQWELRKTRCLKTLIFVKGWLKFIKQLQGFKTMVYCQQLFDTLSESPV